MSIDFSEPLKRTLIDAAHILQTTCYDAAHTSGWWNDPVSRRDVREEYAPHIMKLWTGTKIALIHSEASEALEGNRKDKMDEHLSHRKSVEVELADTVIRIFDLAGGLGLDLPGAIVEKLVYNSQRADHKIENRVKEGGKAY